MNLEAVTLQDCIDMYEKKGMSTVIEDGGVTSFVKADTRQKGGQAW